MKHLPWCHALARTLLVIASAFSWIPDATAAATKRAVLIGVNDFAAVRDLNGTRTDVDSMRALLINRFDFLEANIHVLAETDATYAAIKRRLSEELVRDTAAGDIVVIYVSSHGSRAPDRDGDEPDGWDETILSQDARTDGVYDITDDELHGWLAALSRRTNNVIVIFDTCNSGTAARATTTRSVEPDSRLVPPTEAPRPHGQARDGLQDALPLGTNFVLISGSRAEELSNEDFLDGSVRGVMTHYLVKTLQQQPATTYRTMFHGVAAKVTALFPSQHPQIEGAGLDSFVFGDARPSVERTIFVDPIDARHVRVHAGAAFGVTKDATISIYPPGNASLSTPIARAKIVSVDASSAKARLEQTTAVPVGARARLDEVLLQQRPRRVHLADSLPATRRDALRAAFATVSSIELIEASGPSVDTADFVVIGASDGTRILGRDRLPRSVLPPDASVEQVASRVAGWARWEAVLALDNPTSRLQVDLDVRLLGAPSLPFPAQVPNGTRVSVTISNRSELPIFVNLLDLTSEGLIEPLLPLDQNAEWRMPPGESHTERFTMAVPDGRPSVDDTFLLLATTVPVDASVFRQGSMRAGRAPSQLDELFVEWSANGRNAVVERATDWATRSASFRVDRVGLDADAVRFAIHTDGPSEPASVRAALEPSRGPLCGGENDATCLRVEALSEREGVFEIQASALRGERTVDGEHERTIGALFEDAYFLKARIGADYVEPLLTVRMPEGDEARPGTRGGDEASFPAAEVDPLWSLNYADVPRAWAMIQAEGGVPRREARGVVIVHPDTGFTDHPEMMDAELPPVLQTRGYNYMTGSNDARDPRTATGTLKHPGHGTASGSVIVSPDGCQLAGKAKCATGSGRGAQLVPLRVNDSVVLFSTAKLAKALFDVAEGRHGTDVGAISLAMGGPPSITLWKAARAVEAKGILFFAAAGNYVRTVVWPARFESVIAVSAINPDCRPWPHASHGNAVDISAPGQAVWRATFVDDVADVGMGAGTTFATGTMAGVGALWLAHHRSNPALAQLRASGELTATFRSLVQRTAWRPDRSDGRPPIVSCQTSWDADDYGPGVVNANALLNAELPNARGGSRAAEETVPLPLFGSLYAASAATRQPAYDYRALLGGNEQTDDRMFETEVMYHYTSSESVQHAIGAVLAGDRTVGSFENARSALLAEDLSRQLRARLMAGGGAP